MYNLLAEIGRKVHPILGDGNCFFRAISYIIYDVEDFHSSVRATLVKFAELNASCFAKYCTSTCISTHIQCMKRETVFATQMEAHVAASCLQRTVYIYTQKNGSGEHYWERFEPIPPSSLKRPADCTFAMHPFRHVELCHIHQCHYDVVVQNNGQHPHYPPPRPTTVTYIDLVN